MARSRWGIAASLGTVVVAVLAVLLLRVSHDSVTGTSSGVGANGTLVSYSYSCCRNPQINAVYRPGDVISARWIRATNRITASQAVRITLSMKISGPYSSVPLLKSSSVGEHPKRGTTNAASRTITLLNTVPSSPTSILRIPANAGGGYYNLTFTTGTRNLTVSGSSIIRVTKKALNTGSGQS